MSDTIVTALITGGFALIGTFLTVRNGNQKIMAELEKHNAVQDEKIENLTREVRKHNGHQERIVALETKVDLLEKNR